MSKSNHIIDFSQYKIDDTWISTTALNHFSTLFGQSMSYLHNTLAWAITIVVGGMVTIVIHLTQDSQFSIYTSCFLLVITLHLGIRTAKAYLSVMRFGTLEKSIIEAKILNKKENWNDVTDKILSLHCMWYSPLKIKDIVYKVLFELGFIYFLSMAILLVFYSFIDTPITIFNKLLIISGLSITISIEIVLNFYKSPYFKVIQEENKAKTQR